MSRVELVNHLIRGSMVYGSVCHKADTVITELGLVVKAAQVVHEIDPISVISWVWEVDHYDFLVIMADAREWRQTIRPDEGTVWMTYDVVSEFSSGSMRAAQLLRQQLILISAKCQASELELAWL